MANNEKKVPDTPSKAYGEAKASLVYRLSELMFGSLLAAYAIGCLGFLGNASSKPVNDSMWLTIAYISVSVTYAYATVGLYLSYHAGILTMHHMPLEKLRHDFLLVVVQAVGFGVSMAYLWSFSLCLGLILIFCVVRQSHEHKQHIAKLHEIRKANKGAIYSSRGQPLDEQAALVEFTRRFDERIVKHASLSGWKPVSSKVSKFSGWLTAIGIILTAYAAAVAFGKIPSIHYVEESSWFLPLTCLVAVIVMGGVYFFANRVIESRASFLYDGGAQMDKDFEEFLKELELT